MNESAEICIFHTYLCYRSRDHVLHGVLPLVLGFAAPAQKVDFLQRLLEEMHISDIVGRSRVRNRLELVTSNEVDRDGKSIRKQREIDFICNKGSKRYYIQSAFAMPDEAKKEQEQKPLLLTNDAFKKIIITKDALAPLYNEEGVLVMSIFDFLLNRDSLLL